MLKNKNLFTYVFITGAMTFWSLSFIWYKQVFKMFTPFTTIFLRLLVSTPFIFLFSFMLKRLKKIKREDLKDFSILAFFQPFLYFMGESLGVERVSSTLSSVIISTIPLFTLFAGIFLFKERLKLINYLGIFFSFVGVFILIFSNGLNISTSVIGLGYLFVAVYAAVHYSILVKKITEKYNPLTIVCYQNLFGMLYFVPAVLLFEKGKIPQTLPPFDILLPLLELGIFASTIAFVFYTYSIRNLGISKTSIFTNLIPVFTAIFAYFILDEKISLIKIIGIVITISGLFISQAKPRRIRI